MLSSSLAIFYVWKCIFLDSIVRKRTIFLEISAKCQYISETKIKDVGVPFVSEIMHSWTSTRCIFYLET